MRNIEENYMKKGELIHESKLFQNIVYSGKETKNREFDNCSFENCDFSNGSFSSCKFIDCVFTNCNLTMVKLKNCQLNNIIFKDSKLLGVNFSECIDFGFLVKINSCVLDYCSFERKKLTKTSFINSSMKDVNFTESNLTSSIFDNCDLSGAAFENTVLEKADLRTSYNYSINPEINRIRKAKFSIYGIIGLLEKYNIIVE